MEVEDTDLLKWLKKSPVYYGKVLELRKEISNWLSYVPQTFPHFTRHTVEHSEAIIHQVSRLIFQDGKLVRSVAKLSPTEAFILIAAAYLHDAGMVASDREKTQILESDEWRDWVAANKSVQERLTRIDSFRAGNDPSEPEQRNFLADIQFRFLLAEHLRRKHHLRARDVIQNHEISLGRFAFQDPVLKEAIAKVCVAHGLDYSELEDVERYPKECDIRSDKVNLQLLAVLLRLGDLLDMGHDRACPLLLNAACPLPSDSIAHWTQYTRITHRNTSPKILEIGAECATADEHRVLQDWCQWIVDEVNRSSILAASWDRHKNWRPPHASMGPKSPTIQIRPKPSAQYRPCKWRFELDPDLVFERLIKDTYEFGFDFIRELVQNALDANRAQMYRDLKNMGQPVPVSPTKVPIEWRSRYPVKVSLREREFTNEIAGTTEKRYVLSVEDCGLGMDEEVISKYLLQVGRSFYVTEKFRKEHAFLPSSRFGIGFLSTFAVSDHVEIETYKPESKDGPIHLVLSGPRNYLLMEKSARKIRGSTVSVELTSKFKKKQLFRLLKEWCQRVEFPIELDELGEKRSVERETEADFVKRMDTRKLSKNIVEYAIRAIPFDRQGMEGELYVFTKVLKNNVELWHETPYDVPRNIQKHPNFANLTLPGNFICLNGISMGNNARYGSGTSEVRADVRAPGIVEPTLSRRGNIDPADLEIVRQVWIDALRSHMESLKEFEATLGWKYRQLLAKRMDTPGFWRAREDMVPLRCSSKTRLISLTFALQQAEIWISLTKGAGKESRVSPFISYEDWSCLCPSFRRALLEERRCVLVEKSHDNRIWLKTAPLASDVQDDATDDPYDRWLFLFSPFRKIRLCNFSDIAVLGTSIPDIPPIEYIVLFNEEHPLAIWLGRLREKEFDTRIRSMCDTFVKIMSQARWKELRVRLDEWRSLDVLPEDLWPPNVQISSASIW